MDSDNQMTHAEKQKLIGQALAYEPPPRPSLGDWWDELNRELAAAGHAEALYGDVGLRYRAHLSPQAAALEIIAQRLARQPQS